MAKRPKFHAPGREDLPLTRHAEQRMTEREISLQACDILHSHGDLRTPSRNCFRLRISRGEARRLERQEQYDRGALREARETGMIVSADGRIVTVYPLPADMRFRRSGKRPDARRQWRRGEVE